MSVCLRLQRAGRRHLLVEREHHVREAGELEEHEEDELTGQVLPEQLAGAAVVELLLRLGALHGVHHQVHQLVLQHRAALLVLELGGVGMGRWCSGVWRRKQRVSCLLLESLWAMVVLMPS